MDMLILFKIVITNLVVLISVICILALTYDSKPIIKMSRKVKNFMLVWLILSIINAPTFAIICIWRL